MDVIVLGSLNMDLVAQVPRLPNPGETLLGTGFTTSPGGKGANQAVAAARLGVQTAMVGRVGDDQMGKELQAHLSQQGIDIEQLLISSRTPTGTALIALAPDNNQIIVNAGANGDVDDTELESMMHYLPGAKVLLLQQEVPLEVVEKAAAIAYTAGLTVIYDPAPAQGPLQDDIAEYISILTPNQSEAAVLTGQPVDDIKSAVAAAETLQKRGTAAVIVKMGGLGCVCATAAGSFAVPVYQVDVLDTVAAGDAFNGGLAAAICQQGITRGQLGQLEYLRPVVDYATAVSAIAVTRAGAQASMPTADEVQDFRRFQAS